MRLDNFVAVILGEILRVYNLSLRFRNSQEKREQLKKEEILSAVSS